MVTPNLSGRNGGQFRPAVRGNKIEPLGGVGASKAKQSQLVGLGVPGGLACHSF